MYLKRLEILGFKSFSDKTQILFQPGITGLVGPNGCGKSNIADAILWALGEQSSKALRGERMEDLIFNGTEFKKPTAMAEVSMTIGDINGEIANDFAGFGEIAITRRVYRSGEGEYIINKVHSRLKDIKDLMIDMGVSTHRTVIEQGEVEKIISSNPIERRGIIEETGGITKYKARKSEALRKLEATNNNLLRVRDIIQEVKRQINSLDRQVRKAEEYKKISAEIKDIELRLYSVEYRRLCQMWKEMEEEGLALQTEEAGLRSVMSALDVRTAEARLELTNREADVTTAKESIREAENMIVKGESRLELLNSQLKDAREQQDRIGIEIASLRSDIESYGREKERLSGEKGGISEETIRKESMLKEKESLLSDLDEKLFDIEEELETERLCLLGLISSTTEKKNLITVLETRIGEIERTTERRERELELLNADISGSEEVLRTRIKEIEAAKEGLLSARSGYQTVASDLDLKEKGLKETEQKLGELREEMGRIEARLYSLREWYRDIGAGGEDIKTAILAGHGPGNVDMIHGIAADMLDVPREFEIAVESVLGEKLKGVILDTHQDIKVAVNHLKSKGQGRGIFIPREPRETKGGAFVQNGKEGIIGPALTLVSAKSGYEKVVDYLLGEVVVVKDLDVAVDVWSRNGFSKTLVTLDGEVVDTAGAVYGGSSDGSGLGLLEKKREMRDLDQQASSIREQIGGLDSIKTDTIRVLADLKGEMEMLAAEIRRIELGLVDKEKDKEASEREQRRLKERLEILRAEKQIAADDLTGTNERLLQARSDLQLLLENKTEKDSQIQGLKDEKEGSEEKTNSLREEVTSVKIDITSLREKLSGIDSGLQRIERDLQSRTFLIRERGGFLSDLDKKMISMAEEAEKVRSEIESISSRLSEQRSVLTEMIDAHSGLAAGLKDIEDQLLRHKREMDLLKDKASSLELRRVEVRLKTDQIREFIQDNYHRPIEEISGEHGELQLNTSAAEEGLSALKKRLEVLGPVNIAAIDEYRELEERHIFLTTQEKDLTQSIESLYEAIAKMNQTASELFLDTFSKLNEKFQEVYSSLFKGGTARLELLDPARPLESGVEIVAEPAGKRLRNISLLSGGEKALTAIALLFASFLIHPSPFLILDEIDAPLDEENVRRFSNLLSRMKERCQLIIITHNKRTMEMADTLHGITMEEPALSKIVSVRL